MATAAAPPAATSRVPSASQTFASSSGSPARCSAWRSRALSCWVVVVVMGGSLSLLGGRVPAGSGPGRCGRRAVRAGRAGSPAADAPLRVRSGYLGGGLSREVTPIRFQALIVTITAIRLASSASSKCRAASS